MQGTHTFIVLFFGIASALAVFLAFAQG